MKNGKAHNNSKLKYFHVVTLSLAWLYANIAWISPHFETNYSLQLSSTATPTKTTEIPPDPTVTALSKQIELQLEVTKNVDSYTAEGEKITLKRKDVVSYVVPSWAADNQTDPAKINLQEAITKANTALPNVFGGHKNEVEIIGSSKSDLIGKSTKLRLDVLAKNGSVRLKEVNEFEEDMDEKTSGGVSCVDKNKDDCETPNEYTAMIEYILRGTRSNGINSIEDVVSSYEKSDFVRQMLAFVGKGFTLKDGVYRNQGRPFRVKDGIESRARSKCNRGFKTIFEALTGSYLETVLAAKMDKELVQHGMLNLLKTPFGEKIKSPYDAPLGTVLVYSGGPGHIEFKTNKGFISDHFNFDARTGSANNGRAGNGRKLVGVYMMPTPEAKLYLANLNFYKGSKNANTN